MIKHRQSSDAGNQGAVVKAVLQDAINHAAADKYGNVGVDARTVLDNLQWLRVPYASKSEVRIRVHKGARVTVPEIERAVGGVQAYVTMPANDRHLHGNPPPETQQELQNKLGLVNLLN